MTQLLHEAPTCCDACCSFNIAYVEDDSSQRTGWRFVWKCEDCGAKVGTHAHTDKPLGRMADAETRHLRAKAHEAFDPIYKTGLLRNRQTAYEWLARELSIDWQECHFAWLNKEQLRRVVAVSLNFFRERSDAIDRRNAKRRKERSKQLDREFNRMRARKKQR